MARKQPQRCYACAVATVLIVIASPLTTFLIIAMLGSAHWTGSIVNGGRGRTTNLEDRVYSPAQTVKKFQAVEFDGNVDARNMYKGDPSPGLDNAWRQLYDVEPLLVTSAELRRIHKTSVELPSRPGYYLAKLAVFHQLHCLDKVRQYVHNDYYKLTDEGQSVSMIDHVDHCIDIIRQSLMCQSDTALITFDYSAPLKPVEPDFRVTHACTNFDIVHEWAKDREVNMTEEAMRNPEPFKKALLDELDKKLTAPK